MGKFLRKLFCLKLRLLYWIRKHWNPLKIEFRSQYTAVRDSSTEEGDTTFILRIPNTKYAAFL